MPPTPSNLMAFFLTRSDYNIICKRSFSFWTSPKNLQLKICLLFCCGYSVDGGKFHSAFVGVDVPETLKLPLPSGSWSQSHCFLQCGHPTGGEVQTMAFHCCWMQIDIVCWEQGLNLFVVGVLLLDKWTLRWRRPYSRCGTSLLKNEYIYSASYLSKLLRCFQPGRS